MELENLNIVKGRSRILLWLSGSLLHHTNGDDVFDGCPRLEKAVGYIPFFVEAKKRSEAALLIVIQGACVMVFQPEK